MTKKLVLYLIFTLPVAVLSLAKTWEVPAGSVNNKITVEVEFPGDSEFISCKIEKIPEMIKYISFVDNKGNNDRETVSGSSDNTGNKINAPLVKYAPFKNTENRVNNKSILKKYVLYFDIDEKSKTGETGKIELKFSDSSGKVWHKVVDLKIASETSDTRTPLTETSKEINKLFACKPNPFGICTEIKFSLVKKEAVQVCIYDIQGRLVKTIVSETVVPGTHIFNWDGKNNNGQYAANGVYFISIKAESFYAANKVIYIK